MFKLFKRKSQPPPTQRGTVMEHDPFLRRCAMMLIGYESAARHPERAREFNGKADAVRRLRIAYLEKAK